MMKNKKKKKQRERRKENPFCRVKTKPKIPPPSLRPASVHSLKARLGWRRREKQEKK